MEDPVEHRCLGADDVVDIDGGREETEGAQSHLEEKPSSGASRRLGGQSR